MQKVQDVRNQLIAKLEAEEFVTDKTGVKTIEIIGCTFNADEAAVFGEVNWDYVDRELEWYKSQSLFVKDIPGKTPAIWETVSSTEGKINSNYGWCIFSEDNGSQYKNALSELLRNPDTRRAQMIYTRPSMWEDFNKDGMSDFMCTDANQFFIRDGRLHMHVRMRSCDGYFGYRNDRAWADYVLTILVSDYNKESETKLSKGDIIWTAGSFHIYERHFKFVEG